jgi:hypothetical protein
MAKQAIKKLNALAARIRTEHEATAIAIERGVEHAINAGRLLIEAKQLLKHGEWLPWLEKKCAVTARMAQVYMRLARSSPEIEKAKAKSISYLTIPAAVELLSSSREDRALSKPKPVDPDLIKAVRQRWEIEGETVLVPVYRSEPEPEPKSITIYDQRDPEPEAVVLTNEVGRLPRAQSVIEGFRIVARNINRTDRAKLIELLKRLDKAELDGFRHSLSEGIDVLNAAGLGSKTPLRAIN